MNDLERLLNLVPFISTHQGISLQDLSKEFNISKKALIADLETLFLCGLPGYTPLELIELSFDDGFVSIRNAEELVKPRNLTSGELTLLLIGLENLMEISPENSDRISKLIARITALVSVPVDFAPPSHLQNIRFIQDAIVQSKKVRFRYTSRYRDESRIRDVSPLSFSREGSHLYVRGFCENACGYRTFDLERISGIELLDEPSYFPLQEEEKVEITISITKRYRRFIELFGKEKFETFSLIWPLRAVVSGGGDVIAIHPQELRHEIASRARSALAQYQQLR